MTLDTGLVKTELIESYVQLYPGEVADQLNSEPNETVLDCLSSLPLELARDILIRLRSDVASEALESMDKALFTKLFPAVDSYTGTIMLSTLKQTLISQRLSLLTEKHGGEIKCFFDFTNNKSRLQM
jgi:Mg/Co/Ni transporter MgtE